jgi:hypothetical protein
MKTVDTIECNSSYYSTLHALYSYNYACKFVLYRSIEIQEFYELTLCDEDKSLQQKTAETLQVASKWEHHSPIHVSSGVPPSNALPQPISAVTSSSPLKAVSSPVIVVLSHCNLLMLVSFKLILNINNIM